MNWNNLLRIGCLLPVLGILAYVTYWGVYTYRYGLGQPLGNGYAISGERSDDIFVYKNGKIVIAPTVIEWATASDYFVGLRMPAQQMECDDGSWYTIRVFDEREYIVLNMKTDDVSVYDSREVFEDVLDEMDMASEVYLDYSSFDAMTSYYVDSYGKNYFSNCVPIGREVGSPVD